LRTYDTSDIAATLTRRQRHAQLKLMVSRPYFFGYFSGMGRCQLLSMAFGINKPAKKRKGPFLVSRLLQYGCNV
jgi:hypothetical protein